MSEVFGINDNTVKPNHHPIYLAAKELTDYMRTNSGAATGLLVGALYKAVDDYEDLTIPDFLRRPLPAPDAEWTVIGGTDAEATDDEATTEQPT